MLLLALVLMQNTLPPGAGDPDAPVHLANPLGEAEDKLEAKDWTGAGTALRAYLANHPGDARGLYDLGYANDAVGNTAEAEADYRKAIAADPKQFEAHAALGLLLAREGQNEKAAAELKAAAQLNPNPPDPELQAQSNRTLARLLEPREPERARQALVAALRESQETPEDQLLAGEIAARLGEKDAAADAYAKALDSAPTHSSERAQASAGLAHLLIEQKRWPDAEPVLRKALMEAPTDPALNAELAQVLTEEGKSGDAAAVLENLHAAKPDDPHITAALADVYTQTGAAAKAGPLYEEALKTDPHNPALLAEHGDALVKAGHFAEALPPLEEATRLDPGNGNAWGSLAFAASQTHQPQLVLDALAMRTKVIPETAATYFLEATACDTLHETKRAAALYRQFLSVAGSGYPDEVWQARHRLIAIQK